jgi:chromosome segregation ATPase
LVVTLLVSLTASSQTGTNNEPQVCLPLGKAQKIAQDLIRLDSVTAELNKTLFVLERTKTKVVVKDSIIASNEEKIATYLKEIGAHETQFKLASDRVTKLEGDVTTLQEKNNKLQGWIKGLGGGFIATLTALVTVIAIK